MIFLPVTVALAVGAALVGDWLWQRIKPEIDRRRKRPPRGLIFLSFFAVCSVLLVMWLAAGLAAALVRAAPSWHDSLHTAGGTVRPLEVQATNRELKRALQREDETVPHVDPSIAEFDRAELTFRSGGTARVVFVNQTPDRHNISIYRPGDRRPVFGGKPTRGRVAPETSDEHGTSLEPGELRYGIAPAVTLYRFRAPPPGAYTFRCDVYPNMRGAVTVLEADAGPVRAPGPPSFAPAELARRIAEESHRSEGGWPVALDYLFSAVNLALAVMLVKLRSRDRVARFFAIAMLATAAGYNLQSHAALHIAPIVSALHPDPMHPLSGIAYTYAVLLFPDGSLVPRWRKRTARVVYATLTFLAVMAISGASGVFAPAPDLGHAATFLQFFGVVVPLVGLLSQGYRYRRAETAEARQQSRLLLWALAPVFVIGLGIVTVNTVTGIDQALVFRAVEPVFGLIPVALFIGILRYRLWEIDVVINKTILFGALAVFIGAVYVAVVVGIGEAIGGGRANVWLSLAATVVVAVAFEPVRERAKRLANRLVYGERATPYEVIAGFSQRIAAAGSAEEVLPRIAEAAGSGVGALRAGVRVFLPDGTERLATWPPGAEDGAWDRQVPVTHQSQTIGRIAVAKPPGDRLRATEERLLLGLASQATLALHGIRLSEELRARLEELSAQAREVEASRERIVSAQDAERRRLESEIRERVERQLAEMGRMLERAEKQLGRSRKAARATLDQVAEQANTAQETLRDLARGIFPPLLADRGLVPALEGQIRKVDVPVELDGADGLDGIRFDSHAEAAVYFCCVHAMRLGARSSPREGLVVELGRDEGWVRFRVAQQGPPARRTPAIEETDVQLMSDRVAALGGTLAVRTADDGRLEISGRVPAQPPDAAQASSSRSGSNSDFGM